MTNTGVIDGTDLGELGCLSWSCFSHNDNHIIVSNHIQKLEESQKNTSLSCDIQYI